MVNPDAAPTWRSRISRRSYTLVFSGYYTPRTEVLEDFSDLAIHLEGLARAIDEALDDVLPPAEPWDRSDRPNPE